MRASFFFCFLLSAFCFAHGAQPLIGPESDYTKVLKQQTNSAGWAKQLGLGSAQNVKSFGAMGDGTTDDTAAIQAAINSSITLRRGLFLPGGTYLFRPPLVITNTLEIVGEGAGHLETGGGSVTLKKITNDEPRIGWPPRSCTAGTSA